VGFFDSSCLVNVTFSDPTK